MDNYLEYEVKSCVSCKRMWYVALKEENTWSVFSFEKKLEMVPKEATFQQQLDYIFTGKISEEWAAEFITEKYTIIGKTPCCPGCGSELQEIYLWLQ